MAQLVERVVWDHEVARSNRVTPTILETLFYISGFSTVFFYSQAEAICAKDDLVIDMMVIR